MEGGGEVRHTVLILGWKSKTTFFVATVYKVSVPENQFMSIVLAIVSVMVNEVNLYSVFHTMPAVESRAQHVTGIDRLVRSDVE